MISLRNPSIYQLFEETDVSKHDDMEISNTPEKKQLDCEISMRDISSMTINFNTNILSLF